MNQRPLPRVMYKYSDLWLRAGMREAMPQHWQRMVEIIFLPDTDTFEITYRQPDLGNVDETIRSHMSITRERVEELVDQSGAASRGDIRPAFAWMRTIIEQLAFDALQKLTKRQKQ